MAIKLRRRQTTTAAWTAADYDSYEVLASIGIRRPAARVNQARSARPVRRAVLAALRQTRHHRALHTAGHQRRTA